MKDALWTSETKLLPTPVVQSITVRRLRAVAPHEHRAVQITLSPYPGARAGTLLREAINHADVLTMEPPHDNELVKLARAALDAHNMLETTEHPVEREDLINRISKALNSDFRLQDIETAIEISEAMNWHEQACLNAEIWLNENNAIVQEN